MLNSLAGSGRTSSARCTGLKNTATLTATALSKLCAAHRMVWCSKAGKTRGTLFSIKTELLSQAPLALCEVQGYVYAAKLAAAAIATLLDDSDEAVRLVSEAELLKEQFNQVFWCDELSTYALALDQQKRPCKVRASNAGHCLFAGIATDEYAERTAKTLMSEDFFSGWGIRTLSTNEVRYNPMSYHNGSVWPHDNAVIAAGFARYGLKEPISKVITGLFEASLYFEMHRLPELFCGFPETRRRRADSLSGCLRSPGMGGGLGVLNAASVFGTFSSRERGQGSLRFACAA